MNIIHSLRHKLDALENWGSQRPLLAAFLVGLTFAVVFFAIALFVTVFVHIDDRLLNCAGLGVTVGVVMSIMSWQDFR